MKWSPGARQRRTPIKRFLEPDPTRNVKPEASAFSLSASWLRGILGWKEGVSPMPIRTSNYIKFFVAAVLAVSCCLIEADAQTKKKRTRRTTTKTAAPKPVITNPPIAPATETAPATGDVKIISTADPNADPAQSPDPTATAPAKKAQSDSASNEDMKKTINDLSTQVDRLNNKLSDMTEDDRYHLDMERLTRAEQRSEQLRMQLIDTE